MKIRNLVLFLTICTGTLLSTYPVFAQDCGEKDYDCKISKNRALINADPNDIEAYYNLGLAYQGKADHSQAVTMFDKYLAGTGIKAEYMADGYWNRAWSQEKLGRLDLAASDYNRAVGLVPTSIKFLRDRGRVNNDLKNYSAALADFTKIISLGGKDAGDYFGRGLSNMGQLNNAVAIPDFTKVISIDPKDVEAYYNRGTCYYRTKQYALAITDLNKYIGFNDANDAFLADGFENRGLAHYYLAHYTLALADFTKVVDLSQRKSGYQNRAMAYRKLGKIALAQADEAKAAEMP